jgi:predicted ester cyclase
MERFANAWQDVWDSHDVTTYEGVVSPDAVHHFGVRSDAVGLPAIQNGLTGFFTAFPDLKGPIEDIVVDGDQVAFRYTDSGTDTGGFFGAPPTGNPVSWTGMTILRVSCGLIVESWAEVDGLSLWRELGLLENPGTPAPA